jgi:hypothetical protein
MMRRASALVTLYVLAVAATAYAECAWVLRQERPALSNQFELDNYRPGGFGYRASVKQWPKTRIKRRRCRATNNREGVYRKVAGSASPTPWTRAGRRGSERRSVAAMETWAAIAFGVYFGAARARNEGQPLKFVLQKHRGTALHYERISTSATCPAGSARGDLWAPLATGKKRVRLPSVL